MLDRYPFERDWARRRLEEWAAAGRLVLVNPAPDAGEAVPEAPVVSVAVTVTAELPDAVGVPEITPVEVLIDRPAGRPVAL